MRDATIWLLVPEFPKPFSLQSTYCGLVSCQASGLALESDIFGPSSPETRFEGFGVRAAKAQHEFPMSTIARAAHSDRGLKRPPTKGEVGTPPYTVPDGR